MCLAVPGRIESIVDTGELTRTGRVNFGGTVREVSLALVPEARPGDYVLVHVGLALSTVDETEAQRTLEYLRQMDELGDATTLGPADTAGPGIAGP
ncbi:MAG: HypC/HybG/HupF family hydrogenase formation chaperone [Verrucomicrobiales bacterium]|nr:HypC/HybG/HupF family hydrogenase formation chaperone [Verrucomicrobiales bacterium]